MAKTGERKMQLKKMIMETVPARFDERDSWVMWHKINDEIIPAINELLTNTPPNEPRMINADKLAKRIAGHSNYHGDSILAAIYCAAEGKENDAPIRPIETPPNEPLTLEELRKMDGEPVWVVYDQDAAKTTPGFDPLTLWALVEVTKDSVFLTNNLGGRTAYADDQDLAWEGITAYRRPPEGEV